MPPLCPSAAPPLRPRSPIHPGPRSAPSRRLVPGCQSAPSQPIRAATPPLAPPSPAADPAAHPRRPRPPSASPLRRPALGRRRGRHCTATGVADPLRPHLRSVPSRRRHRHCATSTRPTFCSPPISTKDHSSTLFGRSNEEKTGAFAKSCRLPCSSSLPRLGTPGN
ncbi:hypothetical protein PVAP13_4NG131244 [Panicum virgatum]|uniref:Uncharacterized protein n=1 Tax=Panicum virgatum TaxID=38727 RepID=A0A8T0T174_PANVG|nr:hypothetical protein PVAP13_4NG131244 [Panicum virgatum]